MHQAGADIGWKEDMKLSVVSGIIIQKKKKNPPPKT